MIRKLIAVLLILGAITLYGCGGTKPQSQAVKPASVNIPNETVKNPNEVNIGFVAMTGGSPQAFINQKYSVFADELKPLGLSVKYSIVHGLQEVYPLLDSGNVDFVYMPQTAFTTYVTKNSRFGGGSNYVMIAGSTNINDTNLVMRPGLNSLRDLDGKKVGIANLRYADVYQLNKMLSTVGLKTKADGGSVEVVWDDIVNKLVENFGNRKYDAIVIFDNANNLPAVLKEVPGSKVLSLNPDGMFGDQQPRVWLIAKKSHLQDKPELVKTFLKAHVLSTDKAVANRSELPGINRDMRVKWFTGKIPQEKIDAQNNIEKFQAAWKAAGITYDPNAKYVTELVDYMIKHGYAKGLTINDFMQIDPLNQILTEMNRPNI